jgi:type II secretory pathway pseudopilin PulG
MNIELNGTNLKQAGTGPAAVRREFGRSDSRMVFAAFRDSSRRLLRASAFSLVEILVAVGLLAFIIVGLLAMFYQTQRAFRSSATQTDVLEAGRALTAMIRQELEQMHPGGSGDTNLINFLAASPAAYPRTQLPLPPSPNGGSYTTFLQDLTFLRRVNDVWYGTAYRVDNVNLGVGTLYKDEEIWDYIDTFDPYSGNFGLPYLTTQLAMARAGDPTKNFRPVISGVLHFRFVAYDTNGIAYYTNNLLPPDGYMFQTSSIPAYVDLELGILETKTLEQFNARSNNPAKATAYLQAHAGSVHLFKQRIPIRSLK